MKPGVILIATLLGLAILVKPADGLYGALALCCAAACGLDATITTAATAGASLILEAIHIGGCFGECMAAHGIVISIYTFGIPTPVCTAAMLAPF